MGSVAGPKAGGATYFCVIDKPLGDALVTGCVDTELALSGALSWDGDGEETVGEPMIVLRLNLRRSGVSWEDLERKRLRRLCGLGGPRVVESVASCWAPLPSPAVSSSAGETTLAVAE